MATDIEVLLDTSRQSVQAGKSPGLIRGLGVWAATAIVIGAIIGQSIFLMPSDVAREAGSSPKVLLVWLIGGVVVLFGALLLTIRSSRNSTGARPSCLCIRLRLCAVERCCPMSHQ